MIKKLFGFYHNMSMQNKLLVTYLPIVTFAIFCISIISYRAIMDSMYELSLDINRQSLSQMKTVLDRNLDYYDTFLKSIYLDADSIDYIEGDYSDAFEEYSRNQDLSNQFGTMLINRKNPVNLSIIRKGNFNEQIYNDFDKINNTGAEIDYLEEQYGDNYMFQIYNSERVKDREWYIDGTKAFRGKWCQVQDDKKHNNLSYIISITELPRTITSEVVGLFKLTIRIEDILAIDQEEIQNDTYPYLLYDIDGNLLYIHPSLQKDYHSQKEFINNFVNTNKAEAAEQIVEELILVKEYLPENNLILVRVTSLGLVMHTITKTKGLVFIIGSLLMITVIVLTVILSRFYIKRLLTVVGHLERFHEGDFDELIPYMGKDEVGYLADAFNDMSKEIRLLVNKIYKSELELKEIEFSLLQHQINPHFLYNSLSAISRLVEFEEKEQVKRMVQALVSFYRLTLSNGENIITVNKEIEHIKSYISVFKIRMQEKMNVHFDLDENLYECKTIKIILQPFVENTLEHGIYRRKKPINICIRLYEIDEHVCFEVVDDGIGMPKEKLKLLRQGDLSGNSGYAIKNVDRRLKLQYEENYSLKIFSRLGVGTQIIIKIPKVY